MLNPNLLLHHIIMALIPVAFVIFLGWFAGKKKIINNSHGHSLATYVMSFSFPCSLFVLTATSNPTTLLNGKFVVVFWLGIVAMFGLSFLVYKWVLRRPIKVCAQGAFVCSFADMAAMGIPISQL